MERRVSWHQAVLAALLVLGLAPAAARADESTATSADEPAAAESPYAGWADQDVRQLLREQDTQIAEQSRRDLFKLYDGFVATCPDNGVALFLQARARGTRAARKTMRRLLETRLGLPVTRPAEIGAAWDALARQQAEADENEDALESAQYAAQLLRSPDQQALVGWIARRLGRDDVAMQAYISGMRLDRAHLGAATRCSPCCWSAPSRLKP